MNERLCFFLVPAASNLEWFDFHIERSPLSIVWDEYLATKFRLQYRSDRLITFFIFLFCFCFFEKAISKSLDFLISLLGQNVIYTENRQVPPEVTHPKCQFPPKIPIWTNFLLHERSEEWFNPPLHCPEGMKTMKYLWICQCICLAVIKL